MRGMATNFWASASDLPPILRVVVESALASPGTLDYGNPWNSNSRIVRSFPSLFRQEQPLLAQVPEFG